MVGKGYITPLGHVSGNSSATHRLALRSSMAISESWIDTRICRRTFDRNPFPQSFGYANIPFEPSRRPGMLANGQFTCGPGPNRSCYAVDGAKHNITSLG